MGYGLPVTCANGWRVGRERCRGDRVWPGVGVAEFNERSEEQQQLCERRDARERAANRRCQTIPPRAGAHGLEG